MGQVAKTWVWNTGIGDVATYTEVWNTGTRGVVTYSELAQYIQAAARHVA